jgi:hypothetical protein
VEKISGQGSVQTQLELHMVIGDAPHDGNNLRLD